MKADIKENDMHLIKKYPNRRMYDTKISSYVNMSQIMDLIQQGATIQIVDSRNGEDVTVETLISQVMTPELWELLCPTEWLLELISLKDAEDQRQYLQYQIVQRQMDEEDSFTEEHSVEVTEILYTDKLPKLHPLNASRIGDANSSEVNAEQSDIVDEPHMVISAQSFDDTVEKIVDIAQQESPEADVWMNPISHHSKQEQAQWSDSDEEHTVISVSFPNLLELSSNEDNAVKADIEDHTEEKMMSLLSEEELDLELDSSVQDDSSSRESLLFEKDVVSFVEVLSESEAVSEVLPEPLLTQEKPEVANPEQAESAQEADSLEAKMAALRAQFDL